MLKHWKMIIQDNSCIILRILYMNCIVLSAGVPPNLLGSQYPCKLMDTQWWCRHLSSHRDGGVSLELLTSRYFTFQEILKILFAKVFCCCCFVCCCCCFLLIWPRAYPIQNCFSEMRSLNLSWYNKILPLLTVSWRPTLEYTTQKGERENKWPLNLQTLTFYVFVSFVQ